MRPGKPLVVLKTGRTEAGVKAARSHTASLAGSYDAFRAVCREQGVGVIPYSSLGSGFLSGKYRPGAALPSTARAAGVQKSYMNDRGFAVLAAIDKAAGKVGATPAQVALSWLAHRPGITAPIASATSVTQLKELLGAIELRLDEETTAELDRASAWRES